MNEYDHIAPHYVNLNHLKLSDIVKLHTCLLFYDLIHYSKTTKHNLSMVTEQHNYLTCRAANEELSVEHYRTNLIKFCTVIGKYLWNNVLYLFIQNHPKKSSKSIFIVFFSHSKY